MIKLGTKVILGKTAKHLAEVQTKIIPRAKKDAFKRASDKVKTEGSTYLGHTLDVPKWMIAGVGKRGKGSRFGKSRYVKKIDGIYIYFRHDHINPAGTKHEPTRIKVTYRKRGGGVKAGRHVYKRAFKENFKYFESVYTRTETGGFYREGLKITNVHIANIHRIVRTYGAKAFKTAFETQLKFRMKQHGSL